VVYQDEGNVLGVALVRREADEHVLDKLCVMQHSRGQGIASDILDMVKEQVGPGSLTADVRASEVLRGFFAKRGLTGDAPMMFCDPTRASAS